MLHRPWRQRYWNDSVHMHGTVLLSCSIKHEFSFHFICAEGAGAGLSQCNQRSDIGRCTLEGPSQHLGAADDIISLLRLPFHHQSPPPEEVQSHTAHLEQALVCAFQKGISDLRFSLAAPRPLNSQGWAKTPQTSSALSNTSSAGYLHSRASRCLPWLRWRETPKLFHYWAPAKSLQHSILLVYNIFITQYYYYYYLL